MNFKQDISKKKFFEKYALHNEKSVEEVLEKVSKKIANGESTLEKKIYWQNEFYKQLQLQKLIPAGRILANARIEGKINNYSNCYVIDIKDDLSSIYDTLKKGALISQVGGGFGFNISSLRPKNDTLSSGGFSSGPISFMKVFNSSGEIIQTGGARRAAIIIILNIDHPDIEDFIVCKQGDDNNALTQMNISVGITDKFIKAVKNDENWKLKFNGKTYKIIKAKMLYDKLINNSFIYNEPGIFCLDTVNKYNNGYYIESFKACNPCGELPLFSRGESCILSSLNLPKFVKNSFTNDSYFDFASFKESIRIAVRFLDNVIDCTQSPFNDINKTMQNLRRIGLGFTGLGDMFAMLKIKYGEEESKKLAHKIGETLRNTAYLSSSRLAFEKGKFSLYDDKILNSNFIKTLPINIIDEIKKYGLRNISLLSIAPTGTISLTLGENCSSGIEPIVALEYERTFRTNTEENDIEKIYNKAWLMYNDYINSKYKFSNKKDDIFKENGEIKIPDYFITTSQIDPYKQIDIQTIFQKYIDSSISKTINLPENYNIEKYKNLFLYAYEKEVKGITTYNPSGKLKGIINTNNNKKIDFIVRHEAPKRPKILNCDIHQAKVKENTFTILVGLLNGSLYEVFVDDNHVDIQKHNKGQIKKNGKGQYDLFVEEEVLIKNLAKSFNHIYGNLTRLISLSLRHGTPLEFIVEQLNKGNEFINFSKALARILKKYIKDGEKVKTSQKCPECGNTEDFVFIEGCIQCKNCLWCGCS